MWPTEKWRDELITLRIEKLLFNYSGILRLRYEDNKIGDDRNFDRTLLDIPFGWRTYGRQRDIIKMGVRMGLEDDCINGKV